MNVYLDFYRRHPLLTASGVVLGTGLGQFLPPRLIVPVIFLGALGTALFLVLLKLVNPLRTRWIRVGRRYEWFANEEEVRKIEVSALRWQNVAYLCLGLIDWRSPVTRSPQTRSLRGLAVARPRTTRRIFRHRAPRRAAASGSSSPADGDGGGGDPPDPDLTSLPHPCPAPRPLWPMDGVFLFPGGPSHE